MKGIKWHKSWIMLPFLERILWFSLTVRIKWRICLENIGLRMIYLIQVYARIGLFIRVGKLIGSLTLIFRNTATSYPSRITSLGSPRFSVSGAETLSESSTLKWRLRKVSLKINLAFHKFAISLKCRYHELLQYGRYQSYDPP